MSSKKESLLFLVTYGWVILASLVVIFVVIFYLHPSINNDPYTLFEINRQTLDSVCKNVTDNLNSTFIESNTNAFFCKLNNEALKVVGE